MNTPAARHFFALTPALSAFGRMPGETINKKLTYFVGAPTGPGVSDDGEEFSPFLSLAHKHPAEEEA